MTTSNMNLTLPVPSSTLGPLWAQQTNTVLTQIDAHDHSASKGVKVTPAGFNFTSDMNVKGWRLYGTKGLQIDAVLASPTLPGEIHNLGGNLYWVSSNGTAVQITSGTGLNLASVGTIGGDYGQVGVTATVTYSGALKTYVFLQSANTTGKVVCSDILLSYPGASENSVTLKAQTGSAAYNYSFPVAAPVSNDSVMAINTSGVNLFKTLLGTANQITITSASGSFTFSLPQSIAAASSPTFAGMTLTAFSGVVKATAGVLSAASIVNADISASAAIVDTKLAQLTTASKVADSANATLTAATNANTVSTLVKRDGSGNFSAGTISAALSGNVTGNCSGNCSGSSGSCTGNAASATTAAACSGNSATSTTAAACSGNTAGSSGSCTGNSATATTATNVNAGYAAQLTSLECIGFTTLGSSSAPAFKMRKITGTYSIGGITHGTPGGAGKIVSVEGNWTNSGNKFSIMWDILATDTTLLRLLFDYNSELGSGAGYTVYITYEA